MSDEIVRVLVASAGRVGDDCVGHEGYYPEALEGKIIDRAGSRP